MWDRKQIKARGKAAFKANYWACVVVGLVLTIIMGGSVAGGRRATSNARPQSGSSIVTVETTGLPSDLDSEIDELNNQLNALTPEEQAVAAAVLFGVFAVVLIVGIVLKIFLFNPLTVGCNRFFRINAQDPGAVRVGLIGEGFGNYGHVFVTLFLRDLFIALWCILLIVPGIIKSYSYTMVPYIIKDYPNLSPNEVLKMSAQMMQGHKMKTFVMDLSFIGWFLLGGITFGLVDVFWTVPYYESSKATLYLELSRQGARY